MFNVSCLKAKYCLGKKKKLNLLKENLKHEYSENYVTFFFSSLTLKSSLHI